MSRPLQHWLSPGRRETLAPGVMLQIVDFCGGPSILMLHGFATWSYDWAAAAMLLGNRARIIAPDFLGYGLSDKPRRRYSIDEQAGLILAALAARAIIEVAPDPRPEAARNPGGGVDVPFALVWGLADPVLGAPLLATARRAYSQARIIERAGAGHFPQLDAPSDVAVAILENANRGWATP